MSRSMMNCLIRERTRPIDPYSRLNIRGIFGNRIFNMKLERDTGVTTADLAREVECHVGVPPHKQKLLFRGLVLDPPDTGTWAPRLEELHFRDGDKVHVIFEPECSMPDYDSIKALEEGTKRVGVSDKMLARLVAKVDAFFKGEIRRQRGSPTMSSIREEFEYMKSRYRADIEAMSTLHFDVRNVVSKARRRQTIDHAQRQIDKCSEFADAIFERIATAHVAKQRSLQLPPIKRR